MKVSHLLYLTSDEVTSHSINTNTTQNKIIHTKELSLYSFIIINGDLAPVYLENNIIAIREQL
jgi:hypothetical protein